MPKNLNDALTYLECKWSEKDKEEFKIKNESEAVIELHFGTGLAIRNNWGLWKKKENSIKKYFKRLEIYHPDDISSIILTSFHRKLNGKDIDLEKQVNYYIDYWKKADVEKKMFLVKIEEWYDNFQIGSKANVYFSKQFDREFPRISGPSNNGLLEIKLESDTFLNQLCRVEVLIIDKKKDVSSEEFILITTVINLCGFDKIQYGSDNFIEKGFKLDINLLFDPIIFQQK